MKLSNYMKRTARSFTSPDRKRTSAYPRPRTLKKEFAKYSIGAGTIKLPLDEPLPLALITKVVKARVSESI